MYKKLLVPTLAAACMSFNHIPNLPERPGVKGDYDHSGEFYTRKGKAKKLGQSREGYDQDVLAKLQKKAEENKKKKK